MVNTCSHWRRKHPNRNRSRNRESVTTKCESTPRKYIRKSRFHVHSRAFFKDSIWRPTGDEQFDWFVPLDYVDLVHTRS